ncbi:F-box protein FBW2 isoform X2 [Carica papaya]|nr:F-box protein FBW2 isoform X2 [Carica papaya]XP_021900701.1 F-box protein FBW2 isoform X2 [Carica papaya]XP_021900702.1 F-box protein FBW2 isoform X2 [Carica papaya]
MEDGSDFRRWDDLIPDALGLIFRHLSLEEVLTVVPRVCKSWNKAVKGPYCWQEIDIESWSNCCAPEHLDRMLQMLITRSSGSLRKLSVSGLQNDSIFSFITQHAGSLQALSLPRSEISDSIVEQTAGRLSTVTYLDLSYCCKIGPCALETIGKHCKLLVELCRNMHPLDTAGKSTQDDEAHAIANSMPKLKRLEVAYQRISTEGVLKILSSCPELEFLELRGCWDVKLDDKFLNEKFPKLKVLGPLVKGYYEMIDWDDCSEYYSDSSDYPAWAFLAEEMGEEGDFENEEFWDDEGRIGDLEFRFFEGLEDAGFFGWPPSP